MVTFSLSLSHLLVHKASNQWLGGWFFSQGWRFVHTFPRAWPSWSFGFRLCYFDLFSESLVECHLIHHHLMSWYHCQCLTLMPPSIEKSFHFPPSKKGNLPPQNSRTGKSTKKVPPCWSQSGLGLNTSSVPSLLCDFGQVTNLSEPRLKWDQ